MTHHLKNPKEALLDDVLERFLPDKKERELLRDRTLKSSPRVFPVQKIYEPATVEPRPKSRSQRGFGALPGSSGGSRDHPGASSGASASLSAGGTAAAKAKKAKEKDNSVGAILSARTRSTRVCGGKLMLQATTASAQPVCREIKPIEYAAHAPPQPADEDEGNGQGGGGDGPMERADSETDDFTRDLMMTMDNETLALLKQQFSKYRNELDVYEFVSVMTSHLPYAATLDDAAQVALVANLKELFDQVDVNGDQRMEWAELTSFIVGQGAVQGGGPTNESPLLKYKPVDPIQDQTRLRSEQSIEKVVYLPELDMVFLCERPSPTVSIYSPRGSACVHELKGHKAEVASSPSTAHGGSNPSSSRLRHRSCVRAPRWTGPRCGTHFRGRMCGHLGRRPRPVLLGRERLLAHVASSPACEPPALSARVALVRVEEDPLLRRCRRHDPRLGCDHPRGHPQANRAQSPHNLPSNLLEPPNDPLIPPPCQRPSLNPLPRVCAALSPN